MSVRGQDKLFRHGILLLAATQVSNACNLLFQIVMGRTLSPEQYGELASMLGIILVLATPMDAVRTAMAHFASRLSGEERAGEIRGLLALFVRRLSWAAVPVLLASFLFSGVLAGVFQLSSRTPIYLTGLIVAGSFLTPVFIGALQGIQAFGWMALAQHSWSVVRLMAGGLMLWWIAPLARWGLAGHLLGVASSILMGWAGLRAVPKREDKAAAPALAGVFRYFGFSLVILGGFAVLMNADIVMVKSFFPPLEAGLFARAATIGRSVVFISVPIAMAMFPKVTSAGDVAAGSRGTLARAFVLAGLIVFLAVAAVSLWPALPLRILFKEAAPAAEMIRLVRTVTWAMSPLGLVYLAVHFELAQHRFRPVPALLACAAGYVLMVILRHDSVQQVVQALAVFAWLAVLWLLAGLPWRAPAPKEITP